MVKELKKKTREQEEQNSAIRRDYENLDKEKDEIKAENEYAREKVKEVLQAMQEPNANHDSIKRSQEKRRKKRTEQLKALLADLGEVDQTQEPGTLVEKLKIKMSEQEERIANAMRDNKDLTTKMAQIQAENESAKEKVKEVLQALREPGANHDSIKRSQENPRKKRTEQLKALLADLGEVDETQEPGTLVEKLKRKMLEQEERIANTRRDNKDLTTKMAQIQAENEDTKEEVKEVLQDLEELADNYAKIQAPRRRGRRCCKTYRNSTTATTKGPRRPRRGTGSTTRSGMSCRSSRAN